MSQVNVPKELLMPVDEGTPTIEISKAIGFTVNLGGYESARIDSSVKVTGALENKELIAELASKELETQIQAQIKDLVGQHDPNKTLLGHRK